MSPWELWEQAEGDSNEYLRLMLEHGYIVLGKREPGTDIFGHPSAPISETPEPQEPTTEPKAALYAWHHNHGACPECDRIIVIARRAAQAEARAAAPPDIDVERLAELTDRDEEDWNVLSMAYADPYTQAPPHTEAMVDRHWLLAALRRLASPDATRREPA